MGIRNTLIVVPAYNEEKNIQGVLDALVQLHRRADVVVVNDGSSDNTVALASRYPVFVVSHPVNLGYGATLQTGYQFALRNGYQYVIQFDGDGQHNAGDVPTLIEALEARRSDVIIGSRFLGDSNFTPGAMKLFAIRFFCSLIRFITKTRLTDPTSGLRGISRSVFRHYASMNRFPADFPDADFLIDVLLHKWKIEEVPVSNQARHYGKSMHSGLRPLIYLCKVSLNILVIVLNYAVLERRTSHE